MAADQLLYFDGFALDVGRRSLSFGDTELKLRPKSYDVLAYLVVHRDRLVGRDELAAAVWQDIVVTDNSLAQCVREIRGVLKDDGQRFIKTVPRRGFMFVAPVQANPEPSAAVAQTSADLPAPPPAGLPVAAVQDPGGAGRSGRLSMVALVCIFMAVVLLAVAAQVLMELRSKSASVQTAGLSVAVVPFRSRPADQELAGELTDAVVTALARFRDVTVVRPPAPAAEPARTPAAAAKFVLRGRLERDGDRARLTVQLMEVDSSSVLWAERYERPTSPGSALEAELVGPVVSTLLAQARHFTAARAQTRQPANLQAHELVLRAGALLGTYASRAADEALTLLDQAIRLDPQDASAWSTLARVHLRLYLHPLDSRHLSEATLQHALEAAQQATSIDPTSASGHASLGYARLWQRRYEESLGSLRKAIALNPYDSRSYFYYGDALGRFGEHRASIEALERARQLDPFALPIVTGALARGHAMLGEHAQALSLARDCSDHSSDASACLVIRAISARALGHLEEAESARRRVREVYPEYSIGRWVRRFKEDADEAMFVAHLRGAGFPE